MYTLVLRRTVYLIFSLVGVIGNLEPAHAQPSVARLWNESLLDAIRIDFPAPTVHARNLYHSSAAMYDAWAAFDQVATGHFYTDKHAAGDVETARNEAISYAAYGVLSQRYTHAIDPIASQALFDNVMDTLGYDKNVTTTVGNSPAAIGNRIARQILDSQLNDGSNEANGYQDNTGYMPANPPMIVDFPAVTTDGVVDPNRWQPLYVTAFTLQNGIPLGINLQSYVGPHWGSVDTFALGRGGSGPYSWSEIDPGAPPQLGGVGDADYRDNTLALIRYSNSLDPSKGPGAEQINISPSTSGNRTLGTHVDQGYALNPVTGQPYADNMVKVADYGRVLAEFWADGPQSETPPGHWNVLANVVADNPLLVKRIGGVGPVVDDLEWDVKTYFALNGAVHDAAVAAWGVKREYDYTRPITMIRYQGGLGQSSDSNLPSYHPEGLPLEPGLIEIVTSDSIADGGKHRNAFLNANVDHNGEFFEYLSEQAMVGKIVVQAWNHEPADPVNDVSGTDWILAENWVPYQRDNFVTPAFAAYVSGHSTFSRAAAEVLAQITGSEYFPGGLGEAVFAPDFLHFESGPSEEIRLQWATYFDAADEAGISRLWGGIHVPPDDFGGRIMGSAIGIEAYLFAREHFGIVPEPASGVLLIFTSCWLLAGRQCVRGK
ncbi:vanadium-dependent haloperoxidase [Bythopirellula goksoeyrii]|uniref:PAP2 superfamily protein n=1 Tax=Bythopirellula goksoeyrii TaxID=1400387 RepID=A0A5B9QIC4_9BACT|nr:vanadium-dependent haloperoxidase [Bythopirellula goksoeyrii]QEG33971.1 PAP2 superfamily protein [Bythopirellula goksoeyrii]